MIRARFWVVAGVLFGLMAFHTRNALWVGDFWEHAAVIRELSLRPLHPRHPLLDLATSHAFFSPYALVWGLVSRATGAGAVTVLGVAGLLNLVLVVTGVRHLCRRVFPEGDRAAFWALLFLLFLWGSDAWMWSGFLHMRTLGYVLPYPSTFAAGLAFHTLAFYLAALDGDRTKLYALVALLSAVTLITHPTTAAALFAGLGAAFLAQAKDRVVRQGALLALVFALAIVLTVLWPYFSFLDLLRAPQSAEFNAQSRSLYADVLKRTWPSVVVAPAVLWRLRENRRDVLVIWLVLLSVLYAFGFFTGSTGYGRTIAFIALVSQLGAAGLVARAEVALGPRVGPTVTASALVAVTALATTNRDAFARSSPLLQPMRHDVEFLANRALGDDVVLADLYTSWLVPAYGGRVVASSHPVYWVPDHEKRREDVRRFFQPRLSNEERLEIIRRWHVRHLLINRAAFRPPSADEELALESLGHVGARRGDLVLVDLAPPMSLKEGRSPAGIYP